MKSSRRLSSGAGQSGGNEPAQIKAFPHSGLPGPDTIVRIGPDDPGTLTVLDSLETLSPGAIKEKLLQAGAQLADSGGGAVVIDGRPVALTADVAERAWLRTVEQAKATGQPLPDRFVAILGDATSAEFP